MNEIQVIERKITPNYKVCLYHNSILLNCGVHVKDLIPYIKDIKVLLLTKTNNSKFNIKTLNYMIKNIEGLKIVCPDVIKRNYLVGYSDVHDIYSAIIHEDILINPRFRHNTFIGYQIYKDGKYLFTYHNL